MGTVLALFALVAAAILGACDEDPGDALPLPEVPAPPAEAAPPPERLTFAVLSDLHTPNDGTVSPEITRLVDALIAMHPRFVVVTGDFTNGDTTDGNYRQRRAEIWYDAVRTALSPLDAAGIPVFPVAGNHDSYQDGHRRAYAAAWSDLAARAAPFAVQSRDPGGAPYRIDAAPFSYAVDVDGVHLAFAHVVEQRVDRDVAAWLAADLAAARGARASLVFGHVPAVSIMGSPMRTFAEDLGGILARGGAAAYIAGHEHLFWDETFALAGGHLHQVVVGCSSGAYIFPPSGAALARAHCRGRDGGAMKTCAMPQTGQRFAVRPHRNGLVELQRQTFVMVDVEPDGEVRAHPIALDRQGKVVAWGEPPAPSVAFARPGPGHHR